MRWMNALIADIKFQLKQGFYLVYLLITIGYLILIQQFPLSWQRTIVPLIVFTDPALIGFFFIGGIIMLERVQGIFNYLMITPLTTKEYLISKILSLSIIAVMASTAIALYGYDEKVNLLLFIIAVFLTSYFTTLLGTIAAIHCRTINEYFIKMVPYVLFLVLPCILFSINRNSWLVIFPNVAAFELLVAAFGRIEIVQVLGRISYLVLFNSVLLIATEKLMHKKRMKGGL